MEFVARFEDIQGVRCRLDTRIYLNSYDRREDGVCVGAIVGKNPGSADTDTLGKLAPLKLRGDKMLPTVGNRFVDAYRLARKDIPPQAFIRVWNLFYVCSNDLNHAVTIALKLQHSPVCRSEEDAVPIVWFGWGGDHSALNPFKLRFIERGYNPAFYFNHTSNKVVSCVPQIGDFAKHTQGMPADPIRKYLALHV